MTYDMKPSRDDPTAVGTSEYADAIIEKLEGHVSERRKVTVVGAGNVGATCAQVLAQRDYADVVLVDIKEGLPQGKALDINQMGAVLGYEPNVTGSNDYEPTAGSDVVVITAGIPRGPGMSRDDLVSTNEKIVKDVTEKVVAQSPDAILIIVSNPLDAMCHVAKSVSGLPKERVFGQAGILDTARLQTFIAWETGASVKDVSAVVLGGHGDQMVSVVSATTVGGVPIRKLVSEERIQELVQRTAVGGGEVVKLLGTSAWYAPGAAAAQMVDSIVLDEKRVLPCTAYLEGEYGIDGLYMGVPVRLGRSGIEEIYEVDLDEQEQAALAKARTPCATSWVCSRRRELADRRRVLRVLQLRGDLPLPDDRRRPGRPVDLRRLLRRARVAHRSRPVRRDRPVRARDGAHGQVRRRRAGLAVEHRPARRRARRRRRNARRSRTSSSARRAAT